MKTEITSKEYKDIYEACDWNPIVFSKALKALRYSDELIVDDNLDLRDTPIQSLGNLKRVRGWLDLRGTPIQSLGNLKTVGGYLDLRETPLAEKYSVKEIRKMVKVRDYIFLV